MIWDWFRRNIVLTIISIFALYMIGFEKEFLQTIWSIVILETIAISLTSLGLYVFGNIDYIKNITRGEDNVYDELERSRFIYIIAAFILGVHALVGLASYTYFAQLAG